MGAYKFFDKKTGSGASVNKDLVEELHKPLIKKFKIRKARFKDNIWAGDLAEMGSLFFFNRAVKYLLCAIDVFTKYVCIKPLRDKKSKVVIHGFIEIANESNRKTNKLSVIQEREFYNNLMQKWLDDNIFMYWTHNDSKSVVAERFEGQNL